MKYFVSLALALSPQFSFALEYLVYVVGKDNQASETRFDTQKDQPTNRVDLKDPNFICDTDVVKSANFALKIVCKEKNRDTVFETNGSCSESKKPDFYQALMHIHTRPKPKAPQQEYWISIECNPDMEPKGRRVEKKI
jgi:hypothetical protein